jgi:hypothetical protein
MLVGTRECMARVFQNYSAACFTRALATPSTLALISASADCGVIDTVERLSLADFSRNYAFPNRPVLVLDACRDWPAVAEWTAPVNAVGPCPSISGGAERTPALPALAAAFGDDRVCIARCGDRYFSDQKREDSTVGAYATDWLDGKCDSFSSSSATNCAGVKYLKDWRLFDLHPERESAYRVPPAFVDDWLNAHWPVTERGRTGGDFRFVYVGPRGSWTPLHRDVFRSYSWSANVCGTKQWLLFPPAVSAMLLNQRGECPYDVLDAAAIDRTEFPRFDEAMRRCIRVEQPEGSAIFVPAAWFHQVSNATDCLSINHNWGNAHNVDLMWNHVIDELVLVEAALDHLRPRRCACAPRVALGGRVARLHWPPPPPAQCEHLSAALASCSGDFVRNGESSDKSETVADAASFCAECIEWLLTCQRVLKASCGASVAQFVAFLRACALHLLGIDRRDARDDGASGDHAAAADRRAVLANAEFGLGKLGDLLRIAARELRHVLDAVAAESDANEHGNSAEQNVMDGAEKPETAAASVPMPPVSGWPAVESSSPSSGSPLLRDPAIDPGADADAALIARIEARRSELQLELQ